MRLKPLDPPAALEAFRLSKEWEARLAELQVMMCFVGGGSYCLSAVSCLPLSLYDYYSYLFSQIYLKKTKQKKGAAGRPIKGGAGARALLPLVRRASELPEGAGRRPARQTRAPRARGDG